jgi:hypothetical protein
VHCDVFDTSDLVLIDQRLRESEYRGGRPTEADKKRALRLLRSRVHPLCRTRVQCEWFFYEHVGTRTERRDHLFFVGNRRT